MLRHVPNDIEHVNDFFIYYWILNREILFGYAAFELKIIFYELTIDSRT